MKKLLMTILALVAFSFMQVQAQAASINPGVDAGASIYGLVRYKNFGNDKAYGGNNVYILPGDNVNALPRADFKTTWGSSNDFSISYNPTTGLLSTTVNNQTESFNVGLFNDVNYLQFFARTPAASSIFANNVKAYDLNGNILGAIGNIGIDNTSATTSSDEYLNLIASNINNGFLLEGTLALNGPMAKDEKSKVEIAFGHSEAPVPEPTTMALGLLGLGGLLARRKKQ